MHRVCSGCKNLLHECIGQAVAVCSAACGVMIAAHTRAGNGTQPHKQGNIATQGTCREPASNDSARTESSDL